MAGLGPGLRNAMIAIAIVGFPIYTRLVRGVVLSLREREFVEAARALGATDPLILGRHILPHLLSPVIVAFSLDVGAKILATAGLSFLGLGTQPPTADWGSMLATGRQFVDPEPPRRAPAGARDLRRRPRPQPGGRRPARSPGPPHSHPLTRESSTQRRRHGASLATLNLAQYEEATRRTRRRYRVEVDTRSVDGKTACGGGRGRGRGTRSLDAAADVARPDGAQPPWSSARVPRGPLDPSRGPRRPPPPSERES